MQTSHDAKFIMHYYKVDKSQSEEQQVRSGHESVKVGSDVKFYQLFESCKTGKVRNYV